MKGLLIVLIPLFLISGSITANYIYINEVSDQLLAEIDAIPTPDQPDCIARTAALVDAWEEEMNTVSLSVSYTITDRISEHAATLHACASCGDRYGFYTSLALLRDAVGDMRRLERFSIGNLF